MVDSPKPRGRHPHHRLAHHINAKRRSGRYADGHGLYLVVDPSGAKRWTWRGVIQGKRCELGLGNVQLVSLATARDAARNLPTPGAHRRQSPARAAPLATAGPHVP